MSAWKRKVSIVDVTSPITNGEGVIISSCPVVSRSAYRQESSLTVIPIHLDCDEIHSFARYTNEWGIRQ
jgi:hypothetical protein